MRTAFRPDRAPIPFLLLLVLAPVPVLGQAATDDPFLWLEEVEGERPLTWVTERSEATLAELSAHPLFEPIRERVLEILDSDDRIPFPSIMGDRLYNFWQDGEHPRGIWRRAGWDDYLGGDPAWETVLDVGALAEAEGVNWAWGGATCLPPEYVRCLVRLSRGGADAVEVREFDASEGRFLDDGFFLPEAKQSVSWLDGDRVLVASDFGPGSMTTSGYARTARLWERGTPLESAEVLFEGRADDVSVGVGAYQTENRRYGLVTHRPSFFEGTVRVLLDGELVLLDLPMDATPTLVGDRLVVRTRSDWEVGDEVYPAGALLATDFRAFLRGDRGFQVVFAPTDRTVLRGVTASRQRLLVSLLTNVRTELRSYHWEGGEWRWEPIGAPGLESTSFSATSPFSDRYFLVTSGFTRPNTLLLAEADGSIREVRSMPGMFEAEGLVVQQQETVSRDGTRVPYFVVHRSGMRLDASNPTLLYAYGGFEISMTPGYSAVNGATWLERGGVYVVANLRGGGEFGPEWHRTAQREGRQKAYDDFIAVAEDLIARGVTSPERLGIRGGSNGGLLVGVAFTQRPDLFGAVVSAVPLLDMRRYHLLLAGASWMAEYGDPDNPDDWAFIREYSPYQNLREGVDYPRVLFTTTTRDDRVHPGHARKMAARMEAMGHPVYYFENTEGGHGSGVTNEQRAVMTAVEMTYLWKELGGGWERPRF
jgi:prolyl oligopeptidase